MWFKCDPSDWLRLWPYHSLEHYGHFRLLTDLAWDRGGLPDDLEQICLLTGLEKQNLAIAFDVFRLVSITENELLLPRLMHDAKNHYSEVSAARSKAGSLGGRPRKEESKSKKKQMLKSEKQKKADKIRLDKNISDNTHVLSEPPAAASEQKQRNDHPFYDQFLIAYRQAYGAEYQPHKGDFVQMAKTKASQNGGFTLDNWALAVGHYFASEMTGHTLADLCVRYPVFLASALDKFKQPLTLNGASNGRQQQSETASQRNVRLLATRDYDAIADAALAQIHAAHQPDCGEGTVGLLAPGDGAAGTNGSGRSVD